MVGPVGWGLVVGRVAMWAALTALAAGVSPTWSILGSEFMTVVGGTRAGTLTGALDAPGYCLTTWFLSGYARVLERGGWAAIFRRLQLCGVAGLLAVSGFFALEMRKRTVGPHPRLAHAAEGARAVAVAGKRMHSFV